MKEIEIKGNTPEEKFEHLEIILRRMFRRLNKTVIGLIPASPIFGYCDNSVHDPNVLRAIFPADGVITHVAARADKCDKKAKIAVDLISGDEEITKTFPLKERAQVEKIDFPVHAGDSLEIWVEGSAEAEKAPRGVWVGLLYQVGMKDLTSTKLLIDQFEALIGDADVE